MQTLLTCIPHRKSFVIATPRHLMFSTLSRTVPSRVYEAWIFFIRYLVICIILHLTGWNHIPHFLAQHPNWSISYWSFRQCVFCVLYFSVTNTITSEESYFRINGWWDIINVQGKQQGTKDSGLWDTRQNRVPVRFCSVYSNSLLSVAQKRTYPFQCLPKHATVKQFAFKELMRWGVQCFLKI